MEALEGEEGLEGLVEENRGNRGVRRIDSGAEAGYGMGWIQNLGVAASVKHGPTFSENPDNGWTVSRIHSRC